MKWFQALIAAYGAISRVYHDAKTAEAREAQLSAFVAKCAALRTWGFFGSARKDCVGSLDLLAALTDVLVANGRSMANGFHTEGMVWHFSESFRNAILGCAATAAKLVLVPLELGKNFQLDGCTPETVGSPGYVSPPHDTGLTRSPLLEGVSNEALVFFVGGNGTGREVREHREAVQTSVWTGQPFTEWDRCFIPPRFLVDRFIPEANRWFWDPDREDSRVQLAAGVISEPCREREFIIRVGGPASDLKSLPNVCAFSDCRQAAQFMFETAYRLTGQLAV